MENENKQPYGIYFELGIKIPISDYWYHSNFFDVFTLSCELGRFVFYSFPIRTCVFRRDIGFIEQYDLKDFQAFFDKYDKKYSDKKKGGEKNA